MYFVVPSGYDSTGRVVTCCMNVVVIGVHVPVSDVNSWLDIVPPARIHDLNRAVL